MTSSPTIKTSGDIEDVASFFCVSVRTVHEWKSAKPPVLRSFQEGRNVCFGEEAIIELRVKGTRSDRRMAPGELVEIARREWREHLKVRSAECGLRILEERVEKLETLLNREIHEIRERKEAA